MFLLSDKPRKHHFLHFLALAKWRHLKASWVDKTSFSRKRQDQDSAEDTPIPQSSTGWGFQQCGRQCADGHCDATMQHLSTAVLKVWFELPVSSCHAASHCNGQCLLLCPSLDSVPQLSLVKPKNFHRLCLTQVDRWRLSVSGVVEYVTTEKVTRIYFQHTSCIHTPVG
jgi:hypothetical protein